MFYNGSIKEINKIVVSDPLYGSDVWCRYENDKFAFSHNWKTQLMINETSEVLEDLNIECRGVEFTLMLTSPLYAHSCKITEDGFSYPKKFKLNKAEIGMDSACVALGINEYADEIKACRGDWKPDCALDTLTDGFFGNVYEGSVDGNVHMLYITGYLDEDTGYSIQDIVNYLASSFEISNLKLVKEDKDLLSKVANAKDKGECKQPDKASAPRNIGDER